MGCWATGWLTHADEGHDVAKVIVLLHSHERHFHEEGPSLLADHPCQWFQLPICRPAVLLAPSPLRQAQPRDPDVIRWTATKLMGKLLEGLLTAAGIAEQGHLQARVGRQEDCARAP